MRERFIPFFLAATIAVMVHAEEQSQPAIIRIGVIDLERAINEVDEGAKAKEELRKEFEAKQALLDKKQAEAKAFQETMGNPSAMMKQEKKQQNEIELQKKIGEVQQLYVSMQQEMMKRQKDVMDGILRKMNVVVDAIAKEHDLTAVLNKTETGVLFSRPGLDYTSDVIRRYNELYKNKGSSATPSPDKTKTNAKAKK